MRFNFSKSTIRTALAVATFCFAGAAQADFIAAIDQFTITKNGNAFFSDSFSDGIAPPSVPNASNNGGYAVIGSGTSESGGKAFMDSAQGQYVLAGDGTARLRNINTLLTNTDPLSNGGLKQNSTFVVQGLFDFVVTPDPRDVWGIDLKDRTSLADDGQVWSLDVGKIGSGQLGVHLILQDYALNTITQEAFLALDTNLLYDQILLEFNRDNTANNIANAGIQYWYNGSAVSGIIDVGDATIFQNGINWARAGFHTNQETAVVPEPATLALFGFGLAGLGFSRRRKQKRVA